jgi:CRISPR-associated protein Csm4
LKCYEIIIKPQSGFGTPIKGDTLFGHFCWQAHYDSDLLNGGLDRWIDLYEERPFAVFSTAWPKLWIDDKGWYALKRPDLPLSRLFLEVAKDRGKRMTERKERDKQKWFLTGEDLCIDLKTIKYRTEKELVDLAFGELTDETRRIMRSKGRRLKEDFLQPHNTIDRRILTTGEGMFAPYAMPSFFFYPEIELSIFILINEEATDIARVRVALERIGSSGFGRDASTGLGRFDLGEDDVKILPDFPDANACYTLSPAVPEKGVFKDTYFTPFTRFGRHGDILASSGNPFKNPVIMADEGAIFVPADKNTFKKPYLGRAVRNLSKSEPRTIAQGYAPYLPLNLEIQT